jgi:hypothetical protein
MPYTTISCAQTAPQRPITRRSNNTPHHKAGSPMSDNRMIHNLHYGTLWGDDTPHVVVIGRGYTIRSGRYYRTCVLFHQVSYSRAGRYYRTESRTPRAPTFGYRTLSFYYMFPLFSMLSDARLQARDVTIVRPITIIILVIPRCDDCTSYNDYYPRYWAKNSDFQ